MEKIIKELTKNIIGGIIGTLLILGFFFILGIIEQFIENHFWLMIPLSIIVIVMILKEVSNCE